MITLCQEHDESVKGQRSMSDFDTRNTTHVVGKECYASKVKSRSSSACKIQKMKTSKLRKGSIKHMLQQHMCTCESMRVPKGCQTGLKHVNKCLYVCLHHRDMMHKFQYKLQCAEVDLCTHGNNVLGY